MKNKIKYTLLMLLCAVFSVGSLNIAAQTGSKATSADVAGMIEFYEWMFETSFSPSQRAEFKQLLEQDFRDDAAKARNDTNFVINTFADIKQMRSETRLKSRQNFIKSFLPELEEKQSTDKGAGFLLNVYRSARSSSGSSESTPPASPSAGSSDNPKNGGDSSSIVGKWMRGTGSGYVSPGGKTQHRVSDEHTFEFLPGGTVAYTFESDLLNLMQCRIRETVQQRGKYTINGDVLTIDLAPGVNFGSNSCNASANFRKSTQATSIKKSFRITRLESMTRPSRPLILCFDGQTDEGCFEKQ